MIRCMGRDPGLMAATIEQIKNIEKQQIDSLIADQRLLKRNLAKWNRKLREPVAKIGVDNGSSFVTQRLTERHERNTDPISWNQQLREVDATSCA